MTNTAEFEELDFGVESYSSVKSTARTSRSPIHWSTFGWCPGSTGVGFSQRA